MSKHSSPRAVSWFNGDISLVLAADNAGPNAVRRYSGVPPFRETRDYVRHVGTIYRVYRAESALPAAVANDK